MNPYSSDTDVVDAVLSSLRRCDVELLYGLNPVADVQVNKLKFAVYNTTLTKKGNDRVVDAWVILGGDRVAYYNRDNYTTFEAALNQHIGFLVTSLAYKIVDASDGNKRVRNGSKKARNEKM